MTDPEIPSALRARRLAVISAAALSGLLVLVSMVLDPAPDADGTEMVAGYAEHLTRSGLHTNLIHYGFALLAPVVYAMVALVRGRGAWLANIAGVLAIVGLSTLPGLVLLDFTSVATVLATDLETSALVDAELEALPYFIAVIIPAFLTSVLALPLAVVALWRAGLFPGFMALLALPAAVAPNVMPTWWLAFGTNAVWMLAVAYFLARVPEQHWYAGAAGRAHAPTDPVPA
ncbi:hypothetical protein [Nocardioides coralli]|uniref:hypothetical protein n=1 Tax=Nocardioides coralli TaxID=2872154 RepID=UPI001CA39D88|nr:hypothetical protein [Nocardioides coralli]QZY28933.1 hypothetical protein K6T13_16070 [Nocardioides coralli]